MALYADLHRHLGGALHPRIIYKFLRRTDHPILNYFPDYDGFYNWFTRPCRTLEEFVKIHSLVEELQSLEHLTILLFALVPRCLYFRESPVSRTALQPLFQNRPQAHSGEEARLRCISSLR
jgi:adenosine deaminase